MGGPKKSNLDAEQGAYQSQLALGKQLADQGQAQIQKQSEYQQPLVNFLKGQMGNLSTRVATNAVPIGQIARGTQQAREGILDTQPAGAARDFALAGLKRDQSAQTSGLLNSTFLAAFPTLANVGNVDASTGLQQVGGGIRSSEGGAQGLGNINQRDAQTKQSTLGMLGGLAGGIGGAATGGLFKAFKPSGGGGTSTSFLGGGGGYTGMTSPMSGYNTGLTFTQ